jgi:hypothetical protein
VVSPGNLVQDTAWTSQFADPLRMPGNKADALACTQVDQFFGLLDIHPYGLRFLQVIVVLHRHNGHNPLSHRKLINAHNGEADMANLAFSFHLRKLTNRVLIRNVWIG